MLASNLGVKDLSWFGEVNAAGPAAAAVVAHAASAIRSGMAKTVVVYRGLNGRSGRRYGRGDVTGRGGSGPGAFTEPFGLLTPQHSLAMTTRRRMHEYGYTSRQFGMAAVTQRMHANRNPRATFFDQPLTIEDHQASRYVVDPLHLYDCCLESDGGGALVLTTLERARERWGPSRRCGPRRRSALARGRTPSGCARVSSTRRPRTLGRSSRPDLRPLLTVRRLRPREQRLREAGRRRRVRGERRDSWEGGELPVNTSGGHLSEAYMQGMNHLIEAVRQARGESTAQVEGAQFSYVDTNVGAVIFERSER